jgi:hypothetical protein
MGQVPDPDTASNAAPLPSPDEGWARWFFFSELWGWALLMHQATFDRWPHSVVGWALCGCGGALVLWPGRLPLLAVTALVDLTFVVQGLPETANHLLFEGMVCLTWLCALGWHALGGLRRGEGLKELFRPRAGQSHPLEGSLRPLRWGLLLLYWLSVLHKLNYDFLDPDVSCASYMYRRVSALLPILPRARWAEYPAIWGTLLAEFAVPALLLHPRTWRFGLVAALLFHLLLGFDPTPGIYSFTGLLYALFILVLPGSFVNAASRELGALRARVGQKRLLQVRIAWLALWAGILLYGAPREDRWSFRVGFPFFLIWALVIAGAYLFTLYRMPKPSVEQRLARTPTLLWFLPLLVLLNGLNPYLGLRTQLSFSMFSNLRTEGAARIICSCRAWPRSRRMRTTSSRCSTPMTKRSAS